MNHTRTTLARLALVLGALAWLTTADGQEKPRNTTITIDLRESFDLWPSDSRLTLGEVFTIEEAKVKYPDLFRRASLAKDKLTDAQVMRLTLFEAAHTAALWKNADFTPVPVADDPGLPHGGILNSRNVIKWPAGEYMVTLPVEYDKGTIEGAGSGTGNGAYGGRGGGTEIAVWVERWAGNPAHLVAMRSVHHGSNSVYAYSEGTVLRSFRIKGNAGQWHNPARVVTGLQAWDMGECSDVTDLFVHLCDTGINIIRGTPFTSSGCLSLFSNNCAGLAITGGGTINITTLSGDDNARLVHSRPGYGRVSTLGMWVGTVKSESAITAKQYGRVWKPNTWVLEGWVHLGVGYFSHATGAIFHDALFVVKPDVNASHIRVNDFRLTGFDGLAVLLRDQVNKEGWGFDSGYSSGIQEFRWTNIDGGNLESWPKQAPWISYPAQNLLGYLPADPVSGRPVGAFDRVAGTPTWSDVTGSGAAPVPPVVPCSYTYGPWGECVNGTRSRSVTAATPAGCTGTPVLTEACTVAPPVTVWSSTFTGTDRNVLKALQGANITAAVSWSGLSVPPNGTATTVSNTSFGWSGGSVSKVEVLGVTLTEAPNWTHITGNHLVDKDGRVLYRLAGKDTDTGIRVVKGVRYEKLVLPCPGGQLTGVLGGAVGTGSTQAMTVEGLDVYR